jgi:hypothetical protein
MMGKRDAALAEAARSAIAALPLPEGGELGRSDRFAGLTVEDGRISAAIRVNPEEAQTYAGLRSQAEGILRDLPGVDEPGRASVPRHGVDRGRTCHPAADVPKHS